jgi:hypothetical protein
MGNLSQLRYHAQADFKMILKKETNLAEAQTTFLSLRFNLSTKLAIL